MPWYLVLTGNLDKRFQKNALAPIFCLRDCQNDLILIIPYLSFPDESVGNSDSIVKSGSSQESVKRDRIGRDRDITKLAVRVN